MNDKQARRFDPFILLPGVATVAPILARAADPVIPQIAESFSILPATAALLSTAYTLPFALSQPILGPLSDMLGRTRVIFLCLTILVVTTFACAVAFSFSHLMSLRVIAGICGGGLMPVVLALVSDRFALAERRVAISRVLAGAMMGNLIGAAMSGFIGDLFGWRGVFVVGGALGVIATCIMAWIARTSPKQTSGPASLKTVFGNFRAIFADRSVKYCFGAVMIEGWILFGLFPFVSLILLNAGESRASIAGLVLASYGVGSLCYSFVISWLMKIATEKQLMIGGAVTIAIAYGVLSFGVSWPIMAVAMFFVGLSFFMVHGWIQIHVSEILPAARGAALSLHAFFLFLGAALGPILYGLTLPKFGLQATLLFNAVVFLAMGIVTARALTRHSISHPA